MNSDKLDELTHYKDCSRLQGKVLLNKVSGEAKAGRLLAIMGPSGSGKTSLINVLAGQLPASGRLRLTGNLLFNKRPVKSSVPK